MALIALSGALALLMALFIAVICLAGGTTGGRATPTAGWSYRASAGIETKQHANTPLSKTGVHHVASPAGCWPGVWVGPAPVAHPRPVASAAAVPMQRRRPSGIAARATSHGVLR